MVRHFRETAPITVRIEEELSKHPEEVVEVEVVEVSSDEEDTEEEDAEDDADEEEVTIVKEKSTGGPVVGSSSDSSGTIILAGLEYFFTLLISFQTPVLTRRLQSSNQK